MTANGGVLGPSGVAIAANTFDLKNCTVFADLSNGLLTVDGTGGQTAVLYGDNTVSETTVQSGELDLKGSAVLDNTATPTGGNPYNLSVGIANGQLGGNGVINAAVGTEICGVIGYASTSNSIIAGNLVVGLAGFGGSVTVVGPGTLTLSGSSDNCPGGTYVQGGALQVNGTLNSDILVSNAAVLSTGANSTVFGSIENDSSATSTINGQVQDLTTNGFVPAAGLTVTAGIVKVTAANGLADGSNLTVGDAAAFGLPAQLGQTGQGYGQGGNDSGRSGSEGGGSDSDGGASARAMRRLARGNVRQAAYSDPRCDRSGQHRAALDPNLFPGRRSVDGNDRLRHGGQRRDADWRVVRANPKLARPGPPVRRDDYNPRRGHSQQRADRGGRRGGNNSARHKRRAPAIQPGRA